jgi:hypothetical protein
VFAIYPRIPEKELREMAQEVVSKTEAFFANNPKRRVCRVQVWYGKVITIRRKHVQEDIDEAVKLALERP